MDLSKDQKVVIAQVMLDLNYSASKIAEELKVDRSTVYRYGEKTLPEDLRQYATEIKTLFALKQQQLLAEILKSIEVKIRFSDLKSLIHAYEVLKVHTPTLNDIYKDLKHQEKWENLGGDV